MLFNDFVGKVGLAIFVGLCLIYYSYDRCQWGNFDDSNFEMFCVGCAPSIGGGIILKIKGVSSREIIFNYIISCIIIAVSVFVYKKYLEDDEDNEKKQEKTEAFSKYPSSTCVQENIYLLGDKDTSDYYEINHL